MSKFQWLSCYTALLPHIAVKYIHKIHCTTGVLAVACLWFADFLYDHLVKLIGPNPSRGRFCFEVLPGAFDICYCTGTACVLLTSKRFISVAYFSKLLCEQNCVLNMVIATSFELTINEMSMGSVDIYNLLPFSREGKATTTARRFSVDASWAHDFLGTEGGIFDTWSWFTTSKLWR